MQASSRINNIPKALYLLTLIRAKLNSFDAVLYTHNDTYFVTTFEILMT